MAVNAFFARCCGFVPVHPGNLHSPSGGLLLLRTEASDSLLHGNLRGRALASCGCLQPVDGLLRTPSPGRHLAERRFTYDRPVFARIFLGTLAVVGFLELDHRAGFTKLLYLVCPSGYVLEQYDFKEFFTLLALFVGLCAFFFLTSDPVCAPHLLRTARRRPVLFFFCGPGLHRSIAYTSLLTAVGLSGVLLYCIALVGGENHVEKALQLPALVLCYAAGVMGPPILCFELFAPRSPSLVRRAYVFAFGSLCGGASAYLTSAYRAGRVFPVLRALNPFWAVDLAQTGDLDAARFRVLFVFAAFGALCSALAAFRARRRERALLEEQGGEGSR